MRWRGFLGLLCLSLAAAQTCNPLSAQTSTYPYLAVPSDLGFGYYYLGSFQGQTLNPLVAFPQALRAQTVGIKVSIDYTTNATFCVTNSNSGQPRTITRDFFPSIQFWTPGRKNRTRWDLGQYSLTTDLLSAGQTGCVRQETYPPLPQGRFDLNIGSDYWNDFFANAQNGGVLTLEVGNIYRSSFSSGANFAVSDSWSLAVVVGVQLLYSQPTLTKYTEQTHYDSAPGYPANVGSTVHWQYVVLNVGSTLLSSIAVQDDQGVTVTCPSNTVLASCEAVTCTGQNVATVGQYMNQAGCTALANSTSINCNTDVSFYFGYSPAITLTKTTNGVNTNPPDNSSPPNLPQQAPVTWSYVVSNTGNCDLVSLQLSDDKGVNILCPNGAASLASLVTGATLTCTGSGQAGAQAYTNTGSVSGRCAPTAATVAATSVSGYVGFSQSISVVKTTNGHDTVQEGSVPFVLAGSPVTWVYTVTNTGTSMLTSVMVVDDKVGVIANCPSNILAQGAFFVCTATGFASATAYTNTATASGWTAGVNFPVTATYPSGYNGVVPTISIKKFTNGFDSLVTNGGNGPNILLGAGVTWTYTVTNTGNQPLSSIVVTDSRSVSVTCPPVATVLAPLSSLVCSGTGTAQINQYTNVGSSFGRTVLNTVITASSPSAYFGASPSISILKLTNDVDVRQPGQSAGPDVLLGFPVVWKYLVTNTGNFMLSAVSVADNQAVSFVNCASTTLAAGASFTCSAVGTAISGTYTNVGSTSGSTLGSTVTSTSNSAYFGITQAISILKYTNGVDIRQPGQSAGPLLAFGAGVTWTYAVTNLGNTALTSVTVADDHGFFAACPSSGLAASGTFTCSATGLVASSTYVNTGTAQGVSRAAQIPGVSVAQATVTSTSTSTYFGVVPSISVVKRTNGANTNIGDTVPVLVQNSPVTWTYTVTNTGNHILTSVTVFDNQVNGLATCPANQLAAASSFVCTILGSATFIGTYVNIGSAHGASLVTPAQQVFATSPSQYIGRMPTIGLVKRTNGVQFPPAQRPAYTLASPVVWTYEVTNPGIGMLTGLAVTDNQLPGFTCNPPTLAPSSSFTCFATGTVMAGNYDNVGSVVGASLGVTLTATAPSGYFGVDAAISIVKFTNGVNTLGVPANGPKILRGTGVTWTYAVSNTGNSILSTVTVVDDHAGVLVTCPSGTLAQSSTFTCTATGTAISGNYANVGTARGFATGGVQVTSTSPSNYLGIVDVISVLKYTNDVDIRGQPGQVGPTLVISNPVTWKYAITNTGNGILSSVQLTDNRLVGVCNAGTLAVGSVFTCSFTGTAVSGTYNNVGSVVGFGGFGDTVTATSPSNYVGVVPAISIQKTTQGQIVPSGQQSPFGPFALAGTTIVTWQYTVTNTGGVSLTNVVVNDNRLGSTVCAQPSLAVASSFVCTATGLAVQDQYTNVGSTAGSAGVPSVVVTSTSPSGYFGITQSISIVKRTNNVNTNDGTPEPVIMVGNGVTWTYTVTNKGNIDLTAVSIDDDQIGHISNCPSTTLATGQTFTCTATGTAMKTHYQNVGTAKGVSPAAGFLPLAQATVTSTSPSSYFGFTTGVMLIKYTQGVDTNGNPANAPVRLRNVDQVTWTYAITNTGNQLLTSIVLTDNQLAGTVSCPSNSVAAAATLTCFASGLATVSGLYTNVGSVVGTTPTGQVVTSTHPSNYFGAVPLVSLVKTTNGLTTGADVLVGGAVTWKYTVTNIGNVALSNVDVTDNRLTGVHATCPLTTLSTGAAMVCSILGTATTTGSYTNVGTATGNSWGGTATATSPSNYFGIVQAISLLKTTQTVDTVHQVEPTIRVGDPVTWRYTVTNQGNTALSSVHVWDNRMGPAFLNCPVTDLAVGASAVCTVTGTAIAAANPSYTNVGSVIGVSRAAALPSVGVAGATVTATYPSSYRGVVTGISIVKFTNGQYVPTHANEPDLVPGTPVTWTYQVTNLGNTDLSSVTVSDNKEGAANCGSNPVTLAAGAFVYCSLSDAAMIGQYDNVGTAFGVGPLTPTPLSSTSPSAYFGLVESISIIKFTNDVNIDFAAAPRVLVGQPVTWIYAVTNNGNGLLTGVNVQDDRLPLNTVQCPSNMLATAAWFTCSAVGAAAVDSYVNTATAFGFTLLGNQVSHTDVSSYFGATLGIDVIKYTNDVRAATQEDGPTVQLGRPVTWTYVVENTGNIELTAVSLLDTPAGPPTNCNIPPVFSAGSVFTCFKTDIAGASLYSNVISAIGFNLLGSASDTDIGFYNPAVPHIRIIKRTNDVETPPAPFPRVRAGTTVTWTYEVTNTGGVTLSDVQVSDDKEVSITCPSPQPFVLPISATVVCSATGIALECRYHNTGCVDTDVQSEGGLHECDDSSYLGVVPAISLAKFTNHWTSDQSHGIPQVQCLNLENAKVTWTYVVSNVGEDLLSNVNVQDDQLAIPPYCPRSVLGAWDSMTCTAVDAISLGPYHNTATAFGSPATGGDDVQAVDENWYTGVIADVGLKIFVNGKRTSDVFTDAEYQHFDGDSCDGEGEGGEGGHSGKGYVEEKKEGGEGRHSDKGGEGRHSNKGGDAKTYAAPAKVESPRKRSSLSLSHQRALLSLKEERNTRRRVQAQGQGGSEEHSSNKGGDHGDDKKGGEHGEGRSQGEGEGELKGYHFQRRWRGPEIALEDDIQFSFVIENFGTEDLTNVQLGFPDANEAGRLPFVWFTTSDVSCPSNVLSAGLTMTCTAPGGSVKNVGQQELEAVVHATASCDGQLLVNKDKAFWWNKQREKNGRPESLSHKSGEGKQEEGKGEGHGEGKSGRSHEPRLVQGCDLDFWRHPRHFDKYPSIANGQPADITPQTIFADAAGLTLPNGDNTQLSDKIMSILWSWHDDPLTLFLQRAVVALLNSATNPEFVPHFDNVQSDIREALAAYQRGDLSAVKYLCNEWGRTESDRCPLS